MKLYNSTGRRNNPQRMGSVFTDFRDKVENSLTNLVNGSLSTNAPPAAPVEPPATTIAGIPVTTLGIVGVIGLVALKFLRKRR